MGSLVTMAEIREFKKCMEECSIQDMRSSRAFYTWSNKQPGESRVISRIDRVLFNFEWMTKLPASEVHYMQPGLFDHSPGIINWEGGGQQCQSRVQKNPKNEALINEEVRLNEECTNEKRQGTCSCSKRLGPNGSDGGDTKHFHGLLKARRNSNKIFHIKDMKGCDIDDPVKIPDAFIEFYTEMLGRKFEGRDHVNSQVIRQGPIVKEEKRNELVADFTETEVKKALWAIVGDKAPCPDGFGN
ncbi:uncharacterized protein [Nicotiana sylvestris]|uniref:uncharacterized protein n=1 Tax=Nicotiana sylvestris TaxID=4096 RepID=UPI00388CD0D7